MDWGPMSKRTVALTAALLTLARVSSAQSVGNMLKDDFKNAGKDVVAVWGAPFDASGRDWGIAAIAFGAFGASMFADEAASDWAIRNKDTDFFRALKPLRRGGYLFAGKYVVPPVAALYIAGIVFKDQNIRDFVMGCMATWAAEGIPRKGVARLFGRARPDSLPDDPHNWEIGGGKNWMMRSFPAGHFANIMGCASYANNRFHLGAAEPLIYAIAGGVGVGRMADEAHWLSDTVIGGILGYAVGSEIARRSLARYDDRRRAPAVNVTPGMGGVRMSLRWTF